MPDPATPELAEGPSASARADRVRGCLLGGAVGDALGAPVEFLTLDEILVRIGPDGVVGPLGNRGAPIGAVTDDTQMTLFTAEGLIRAAVHGADPVAAVWRSYLRWLHTQGAAWSDMVPPAIPAEGPDGWLVATEALHVQRAPGNTCLSALQTREMGRIPDGGLPAGREGHVPSDARAINRSKGCGGIMRAAPCGLLGLGPAAAFELGARTAAITHGHSEGYLPAGVLAAAVDAALDGADLAGSLDIATDVLTTWPHHDATLSAMAGARRIAATGPVRLTGLEALGGGWVGEEALAIAVAAVAGVDDPVAGLLAAVNHSGDTDSTGAIAGNLLGAVGGTAWLPPRWVELLDVGPELVTIADDLVAVAAARGGRPAGVGFDRYPTP